MRYISAQNRAQSSLWKKQIKSFNSNGNFESVTTYFQVWIQILESFEVSRFIGSLMKIKLVMFSLTEKFIVNQLNWYKILNDNGSDKKSFDKPPFRSWSHTYFRTLLRIYIKNLLSWVDIDKRFITRLLE